MKNKIKWMALAMLILTAFVSAQAAAATKFVFDLEPGQEVPPAASSGSGSCQVNLSGTSVDVHCTFQNLTQPATASHIHGAGVGQNGSVILPLTATAGTSGSITGGGSVSVDEANDIRQGLAYVNLHTSAFPGGELRGQIVGGTTTSSVSTLSQWGIMTLTLMLLLTGYVVTRQH